MPQNPTPAAAGDTNPATPMTPNQNTLTAKVYDSLVSFNGVACWGILQLAQMRQYLAEHLAADLAPEMEALRARVAELEAQRDRRRERLVALQNDALNMRGSLSPNGEARKVPFELGETLTPAVDWLINRVAELESQLRPSIEAERNEIRQSYSALAAQAEQDRDHEGAADVELQLRDREEQWRREDAAPSPRDLRPGAEAARRMIRDRQEATS